MIPDLDLALLKTFAAIVDKGGLTAAGKMVGRTSRPPTSCAGWSGWSATSCWWSGGAASRSRNE